MASPRVHYRSDRLGLSVPACNEYRFMGPHRLTMDVDKVTCGHCRKFFLPAPAETAEAS